MGSNEVDVDELEEKFEDIEECLDDLLIFPNQETLRRSLAQINIFFTMISSFALDLDASEVAEQKQILDLVAKLNEGKVLTAPPEYHCISE